MTTSKAYRQRIKALLGIELELGDTLQWDFATVEEARRSVTDIEDMVQQLEDLRHELANSIKAVHDRYREKMDNAVAMPAAVMKLIGRKQQAGQMVANAKRKLRAKRNEELVPYNEIKSELDELILHLQNQLAAAQKFIDTGSEEEKGRDEDQETLSRGSISLKNFYHDIPTPGSQLKLEADPFMVPPPDEPAKEADFSQPKPAEPELREVGLGGLLSGEKRQEVAEENQRLTDAYENALRNWEEKRISAETELVEAQRIYETQLQSWRERKEAYEAGEAARLEDLEAARRSDTGTMRSLLGRQLDGLRWPPELEMEFATDYRVEKDGKLVRLEVCLPDHEPMTTALADVPDISYRDLVHAIGLRLAGTVFYVLPGVETVLLNGYTGRSDRSSSYTDRSYLYSSKITRKKWHQLDLDDIAHVDPFACFNQFETRRELDGEKGLQPVEPISV